MKTQTSVIPRSILEFNLYIILTNAFLLKLTGGILNWKRYRWTSGATGELTNNLADWQAFLAQWNTYYPQYQDKKGQRTSAITEQLHLIIEAAIAYDTANKIINLIRATVGLTALDCETWNLPVSLANPTGGTHTHHAIIATTENSRTAPTTEGVYPKLVPAVGGFVRCKCYTEAAESGRPHKLAGFDIIEYAFAVFYSGTANLPTSADDPRLKVAHSTKASFVLPTAGIINNLTALAAGAVAPAKVLVIFFRHAKSKHPDLDGPWNGPFTTVLL
jgi:hypothetical protein